MTKNANIEKLTKLALNEVGYVEKKSNSNLDSKTANAGSKNYTKYARDLDKLGNVYNGKKNGCAWCDIFVDWLFITTFGLENGMKLLCQSYNGLGASCTYSVSYYKKKNQFKTSPQIGDQIFFTNDNGKTSFHTGLVVDVDSKKVYTVEGNSSLKSGVDANGGQVVKKSYSLSSNQIYGYGRPDWSILDKKETETKPAVEVVAVADKAEKPSEWAVEAWEKAVSKGLFDGKTPQSPLTREQAAVILYRLGLLGDIQVV